MPAPHPILGSAAGPRLPPGVSPITAGRLGLWYLGLISHQRAIKRTVSPRGALGYGLVNQLANLVAPWTIEEYPGYRRFLSSLCGVAMKTSDRWLYGCDRLPRKHAARLGALCRERAAAFEALASEFEEWADRPVGKGIRRTDRGG